MEIINVGKIASALWKIRLFPFLGNLLAASGFGFGGSIVCLFVLAATFFFLPAAVITLTIISKADMGLLLVVALQLACYAIILLLAISIWGVIQLKCSVSKTRLGSFESWLQAFFGPKSRIPYRLPASASMRVLAVIAAVFAFIFWAGGFIVLLLLWAPVPAAIFFTVAAKATRSFRRLTAIPSSAVLQEDTRKPILFLRSFDDDGLRFKPGFFTLRVGRKTDRFEEKLAMSCWREGPVVAIGKPGERLPEWGACREYHTDETWQARVLELMDEAGGVCMLVGLTEALGWEIHQLQETGSLSKSVFVVPPLAGPEVAKRLERFSSLLPALPKTICSESFSRKIMSIIFIDGATPVSFVANRRTPNAYKVAMHAAFVRLTLANAKPFQPSEPAFESLPAKSALKRNAARMALFTLPACVLGANLFYGAEAKEQLMKAYAGGSEVQDPTGVLENARSGKGVEEQQSKQEAEAAESKRLEGAAEQGDAGAQKELGAIYNNDQGAPEDSETVRWYTENGLTYFNGGAPEDSETVRWYRKAAEQGDATAQNDLGLMYFNGEGVAKDEAEAVKWFRKAAEQGDTDAQNLLGLMYYNGRGVAKDKAEAVKWYRKAAEQGDVTAQNNLGLMYGNGEGVTKDEAEAVKWFRKAAEQGYAEAQNNLGVMYSNGYGVARDDAEAVRWFRRAAEQGNESAAETLRERGL